MISEGVEMCSLSKILQKMVEKWLRMQCGVWQSICSHELRCLKHFPMVFHEIFDGEHIQTPVVIVTHIYYSDTSYIT